VHEETHKACFFVKTTIEIECKTNIHFVFQILVVMASEDCKSISSHEIFKTQFNELQQMKTDLKKQKNQLSTAQTKYHQLLSDYEAKLEQLHLQSKKRFNKNKMKKKQILSMLQQNGLI